MTLPFTEDDFHDLLERETLIAELVDSPGWQALTEIARKRVDGQKARLMSGELTTHEDYLKVTWNLQGAEFVLGLPSEITGLVAEYRRQMSEREGGDEVLESS